MRFRRGHDDQTLTDLDSELSLTSQPAVPIDIGGGRIVNRHVMEDHPPRPLLVKAADIGPPGAVPQDNGDTVEFVVPGVEDVTRHECGGQAGQCCSKAARRSAAIASGPRPSI